MRVTPCVLVTGGAGFIGSNFILHWIGSGCGKVVNLDKLTYAGNPHNLAAVRGDEYVFVQGDVCDRTLVEQLLVRHRPQYIVHFAAESHVDRSIVAPGEFLRTNVDGTFAMLDTALMYFRLLDEEERAAFRFLHISTDEVYGTLTPDEAPFQEQSPYAPNSPYAASKAAADHLVRAWVRTYGLPAIITNSSNNYGPFQVPEKLIPISIANALAGRPIPIYGDGQQVRDWLYVLDHCKAIATVLKSGRVGETYNVGGNNERTNLDVVRAVCELLDELATNSPHRPHHRLMQEVADRPGHDRRYAVNARKIERELGWHPEERFAAGLRKTVQWYLDHRALTE